MKNKTLRIVKHPAFSAVLAGLFFATSYPPFRAWALFFAFAPLWVVWWKATSYKTVILTGFLTQFVLTVIGFNWISTVAVEFGGLPKILGVVAVIGYGLFGSLHVMFAGIISHFIRTKTNPGRIRFFIIVAVVSAACNHFYPTIFSWNPAYPLLYNKLKSAQLASIFGFSLLSTFVYLANACFAASWVQFPKPQWSRPLWAFVIGLAVAESWGAFLEAHQPPPDSHVDVLMVQPNIGNFDKIEAERGPVGFQQPVIDHSLQLTEQGLKQNPHVDLVVWPETSYPSALDESFRNDIYYQQMVRFAKAHQVEMIVGAYSSDGPGSNAVYNAMFPISRDGEVLPPYRKHILLAFGEYLPGASLFPSLRHLLPQVADYSRGPGAVPFLLGGITFAPVICYESLSSAYVRRGLGEDGQIIVNASNDSWYGDGFEPEQHLIMTAGRAVEFRRPLIRVTNTGFSTVIDPAGHALVRGPRDSEWIAAVNVPYQSHPSLSFYARFEPLVPMVFIVIVLLASLWEKLIYVDSRTRLAPSHPTNSRPH